MDIQHYAIATHHTILLPKLNETTEPSSEVNAAIATMNREMLQYGYVISHRAFETLSCCTMDTIVKLHEIICNSLKELSGKRTYRPLYPNFPEQVMQASDIELLATAIVHYWSFGTWTPPSSETMKFPRSHASLKPVLLDVGEYETVYKWFSDALSSNTAMTPVDRTFVTKLLCQGDGLGHLPPQIPFKENLCLVASHMLSLGRPIDDVVDTTSDVLRVMVYISNPDADLTLSSPVRFKSFPRKQRKLLVAALQTVGRLEDFSRHRGYWVRAFHSLHIGELVSVDHPLYHMVETVRSKKPIPTFNGTLQKLYDQGTESLEPLLDHLCKRPGVFARWLYAVLRSNPASSQRTIIDRFKTVIADVPTKLLLDMTSAIRSADDIRTELMYVPKGRLNKTKVVECLRESLPKVTINMVERAVFKHLTVRFKQNSAEMFEGVERVYIDPALYSCPIIGNMRAASSGKMTVARGTVLPFGDGENTNTHIRLFTYWCNPSVHERVDIDLSAAFFDESSERGVINFHNQRNSFSRHSGDIVDAPDGAAEYIDIDIEGAIQEGIRYVVLDLRNYTGQSYSELNDCKVGWMFLDRVSSKYEHFDAKSVMQAVDVDHEDSSTYVPAVFDLVTKQVIWLDVVHMAGITGHVTSIATQTSALHKYLQHFTDTEHRVSLGELMSLHAIANKAEIVESTSDADLVFSCFPEKTTWITPFHYAELSSQLLK